MKLTPQLSAYLDFVRFLAAFAVLLGHMEQDGLYAAWLPLAKFSHEAVIIFFVLSGLIIYASTVSKNRRWVDYVVARSSRIYSVAFPAVLFCFAAAFLLPYAATFDATQLENYRAPAPKDFFGSLLFFNESWNNSANLTLNNPYWSLCYEVWYYILFAAFFFVRSRWRWPIVLLFALIAGPSILALFPLWILGAFLAANGGRPAFRPITAWSIFIGTMVLVVAINTSGIDVALRSMLHDNISGFWRLEESQRLFTDYVIGIAVAAHICAFCHLGPRFRNLFLHFGGLCKYLAGFSFTMYLFHRPFTQVGGLWFPNTDQSILQSLVAMIVIVLACLAISYGTERQLGGWRRVFSRLMKGRRRPIFQ